MNPARVRPWKLVVMESPYRTKGRAAMNRLRSYARACVRDCIAHGESPIASHLLLTQPGILDDDPQQQQDGIAAGNAWIAVCDALVVYQDFGVTSGMWEGIKVAEAHSKPIVYRTLHGDNRPGVRDPAAATPDQER